MKDKIEVEVAAIDSNSKNMLFAIGEPEGILDSRAAWGYAPIWNNSRYYSPPIDPRILGKLVNVAPHHRSAIGAKLNMLSRDFLPTDYLSRQEFRAWAYDYLVLANGYIERIDNARGKAIKLKRALGMNMRRGIEEGDYYFISNLDSLYAGRVKSKKTGTGEHKFANDTIFHLMEPDIEQEIYGTPEYLSAIHSALLNESATIFRRKYFKNGSHAGFILFLTADRIDEKAAKELAAQVASSKGVGNFNNAFMWAPGAKGDDLKLIPVGDVAAKDEFLGIKNVSSKDIMAAHRVPPQLLGVVPETAGGFGDVEKSSNTYFRNETIPLQNQFLEINEWLGVEAVKFKEFVPYISPSGGNGASKTDQ